jgi:uncharacterized protein YqfA (UPF0365 family)
MSQLNRRVLIAGAAAVVATASIAFTLQSGIAASGKATIDAVAKDGIVIKAKARVTVRTNLDRSVGGATEETIIARVGEGIVTSIGSAVSYKDVLENPDRISKVVLQKGLDSGTAFEILSVDIADVDIGDNVGAKLQAEQAEADKVEISRPCFGTVFGKKAYRQNDSQKPQGWGWLLEKEDFWDLGIEEALFPSFPSR